MKDREMGSGACSFNDEEDNPWKKPSLPSVKISLDLTSL
jgi:hypothetical protein